MTASLVLYGSSLSPFQRKVEAVLAIKGTPARPRPKNPADDTLIEPLANPHLQVDAELRAKRETEDHLTNDMPVCLREGRKVQSRRKEEPAHMAAVPV